ncbi:MAG: hypothetical protein ACW96X_03885, partial [Promethearchaeota archaeon]
MAMGFSAIKSLSKSFELQKVIVINEVQQSPDDLKVNHPKAKLDGSLKNRLKEVLVKAKLWVYRKVAGRVNSKSDLLGN